MPMLCAWGVNSDSVAQVNGGKEACTSSASSIALLLEKLARTPRLQASFVEEKHLELIVEPLTSEGRIVFLAPDLLLRHTIAPVESQVLVQGETLAIKTSKGVRNLDLESSPLARGFVESFRLLLRGDLAGLSSLYGIAYASCGPAGEPEWQVRLTPKVAPLKTVIEWIGVWGQGDGPVRLEIHELQGDRTVIRFHDVQRDFEGTASELERRFESP